MKKSTLRCLVIAAWMPTLAWAQATATTPAATTAPAATMGNKPMDAKAMNDKAPAAMNRGLRDARASKLIGMDVRNAKDEDLGDIKDLIVDVNTGRVQYAVLSFGGFMGLGDKLFAFPVSAFKTTADRDELVLNVDKDALKGAPGFERSRWPNLRKYAGDVDRFFAKLGIGDNDGDKVLRNDGDRIGRNDGDARPDVIGRNDSATGANGRADRNKAGDRTAMADDKTVTGEPRPTLRKDLERNPNLRRASELIGRDIKDAQNRKAGEIEDLVVSMGNGRVHYVVIDFDKAWSVDDKLLALPMSSLKFNARGNDVTLAMSRERLDMKRGFDENSWPDLNDARYRGDMDQFLSTVTPDTANANPHRTGTTARPGNAGTAK